MKKLLLAALLCVSSALAGTDIRVLVQKAKPAVVQIGIFDPAGHLLATGTGFFITADGYLLTNYHVITGASSILARDDRGKVYHLKQIAAIAPKSDVVELQFDAKNVPYLSLGSTTNTVEGQRVLVIGNPEGLTFSVSDGIVSAFRDNRSKIQISAPISHGSSGSPVLDAESGQVLGMATWTRMEGQNLNLCISSETIRDAIAEFFKWDKVGALAEEQDGVLLRRNPSGGYSLLPQPTTKSRAPPAWTPPATDRVITPSAPPVPARTTLTPSATAATPIRGIGGLLIWFLLFGFAFRSSRKDMWRNCALLGIISGIASAWLDWALMHSSPQYALVANDAQLMTIAMVADFAIGLALALAVCGFGWICRWVFIWRKQKNRLRFG
jgi:S1-C subfamily serine protease